MEGTCGWVGWLGFFSPFCSNLCKISLQFTQCLGAGHKPRRGTQKRAKRGVATSRHPCGCSPGCCWLGFVHWDLGLGNRGVGGRVSVSWGQPGTPSLQPKWLLSWQIPREMSASAPRPEEDTLCGYHRAGCCIPSLAGPLGALDS